MTNIFYIDGKFTPEDRASIPVTDMAVLRGYGIFDFLRTYGGRPFHLKDHLDRLRHSAKTIGLDLPWKLDEIESVVMETLRRNGHEESNIRIVVTGGPTEDFITPIGKPRLMVMVTRVNETPPEWYENGVKIITAPVERQMPEAKSLNYVSAIQVLKEACVKSAVEVVYIDKQGNLKEGTTSNFFIFVDGALVTPGTGEILSGITRKVVLELAEKLFDIEIRNIRQDELKEAEGAFLSASNKQVLPVVKVDDLTVGDGTPCPRTKLLMKKFGEYTARYARGETD